MNLPHQKIFFHHLEEINKNTIGDYRYPTHPRSENNQNEFLNSKITESEIDHCTNKLKNSVTLPIRQHNK